MATHDSERARSWLERMEEREAPAGPDVAPDGPAAAAPARVSSPPSELADQLEEAGIARLREAAERAARRDAEAGVPDPEAEGRTESERDLVERCRAFYDRWSHQHRRRLGDHVAESEEGITDRLGHAELAVDKFERLTNELIRVKARRTVRHREVTTDLKEGRGGERGLSTRVYLLAIGFLGLVEFFANAPVFQALLPRDALTERQIRLVMETSDGWFAGAERVFAQIILRPDAALLALGVVTFLCVLAHFFGHSLREFVMLKDNAERHHTVAARSSTETIIPMVLTALGLLFALGVLYDARIRLGEVGETQYAADIAQAEEFRRQAELATSDGDLLRANSLRNQADDLERAGAALRDYSGSMSRLSFPILLLNTTLVICALCAAYFHRRDYRREHFNESPFERDRLKIIEQAEGTAAQVTNYLSDLARRIRTLKSLSTGTGLETRRGVVRELESVVALYRAENGRARGVDSRAIAAFRQPVELGIELTSDDAEAVAPLQSPAEYDERRKLLQERFQHVRQKFNDEAMAW